MRLKKIEIHGFKSFADKISLEFDAGITAIVGPNGCGKSNIADAFRWVLGEQSAKSLRGGKMYDIIFAGTTMRKPLTHAEVTIIFTDIDEKSDEDVAITRRLSRNGDSDYFINHYPVRLKDIQSLLLDTGLGRNAFSIFEQGKMDQVIHYSPNERRHIFEEAAGILRFLQRKRESLRKLEDVDQNMARVGDIHLEVEKQLTILEDQSKKAKQYKEHKEQLATAEKLLLSTKWHHLQKKSHESAKKEQELQINLNNLRHKLEEFDKTILEANREHESKEDALHAHREEILRLKGQFDLKQQHSISIQKRIEELAAKEKAWRTELEGLQKKRKQRQTEWLDSHQRQDGMEAQIKQLNDTLKTLKHKGQGLEAEVDELRQRQQRIQNERLKLVQTQNITDNELSQLHIRLENSQEKLSQCEARHSVLIVQLEDISKNASERKDSMSLLSDEIDSKKFKLESLDIELNNLDKHINQIQQQLDVCLKTIVEKQARHTVLQRLQKEMEGFSNGSKILLKEAENPKSPLYQKVKELYAYFHSNKGYESLFASVMRPYSQTLVVDSEADFLLCLAFIADNNLTDCSLICAETIRDDKSNLKGKLTQNHKLPSLVKHLETKHPFIKSFFEKIYISDSLKSAFDYAKELPGIEIVLKDGTFIDRHQVLNWTNLTENNVFLRSAELKELNTDLPLLSEEKKSLEDKMKSAQHKRALLFQERNELDKIVRKEEMRLIEVNFTLQRLHTDLNNTQKDILQLENEKQQLAISITSLAKLIVETKSKQSSLKTDVHNKQQELETLEIDLEEKKDLLTQHQQTLQSHQTQWQKKSDEYQQLLHTLNLLEVKDQQSDQQEKRIEEEILSTTGIQTQLILEKQSCEIEAARLNEFIEEMTDSTAEHEKEVQIRRSQGQELLKIREKHQKDIHDAEARAMQSHAESNQSLTLMQSIENELLERYNVSQLDLKQNSTATTQTLDQLEKEIRSLRHKIEDAGDINMTAIEAYETQKARHSFLTQQVGDLSSSKENLLAIIKQLDGESRVLFKSTFEIICTNFKKNFKILFNGGDADLQLTEAEDILDAGIEIIAKPPGKQMRSIQLLSGGEKCLTALALLFAIFEVKPAPFCILDEIDAPLDDSNIERFVNVVKQFVNKTQFVIITHNKRTMAIADVLFGVSMEERGVSKVLSFEFSKQEAKQEALNEVSL